MVEREKRKGGTKRASAKETPRPVLSLRIKAEAHAAIRAAAAAREVSVSEEVGERLMASFAAETLEALLRRIVREEIGSLELARSQMVPGYPERFSVVHSSDALAVMAEAQH